MSLGHSNRKSAYSLASVAAAFLLVASVVIVPGQAYSQMPSGYNPPKQVQGKYSNTDWGVEMVFPEGLMGMEMSTDWSVSVSMQFSQTSFGSMMALNMIDLSKAPKSEVPEEKGGGGSTSGGDSKSDMKCDKPSSRTMKISGVDAYETIMACSGSSGSFKSKSINIDLGQQKSISLMFMANPASDYDQNIAKFDKSVQTLKIAGGSGAAQSAKLTLSESGTAALDKAVEGFAKGNHKVDVEISASYTFDGKKVTLDKKSFSGKLTIDNKVVKTLTIQKLSISGDLKTVSFTAKIDKSDTVTGKLAFKSALGFADGKDQNAEPGKNLLKAKIGKVTLDTKKTATGDIVFT